MTKIWCNLTRELKKRKEGGKEEKNEEGEREEEGEEGRTGKK